MKFSPKANIMLNGEIIETFIFKQIYLFSFRERGREGEREEERHQCVVASRALPDAHPLLGT